MTVENLKLLAWVGADEHNDEPGIKQAFVSGHGILPLVARDSKPWVLEDDLRMMLQAQADKFGKPIFLARYRLEEIVETITPKFQQQ